MLLDGKNAVVYGGAGSMGGAVARAFAHEGATVFLAGRTRTKLDAVAKEIVDTGGTAHVATLDVHDQLAVEAHADSVVDEAGTLDVSFNAVGMNAVQGVALVDMSMEDFMTPIVEAARSHFITATAAARRMIGQRSGVIVTLATTAAREWRHQMGGFNLACAGIEAFTRSLAHEVGRDGVRVVCLRPNFTPETAPAVPEAANDALVRDTALGRLPLLAEVGAAAVFAASDHAGATTGTVLDLSCGAIVS